MNLTLDAVILIVGFAATAFGLFMNVKNNKKTDTKEAAEQAVTLAIIKQDLASIKSGVEEMREDMKQRNQLYHRMHGDLNNLEKRFEVMDKEIKSKFDNYDSKFERLFKYVDELKKG